MLQVFVVDRECEDRGVMIKSKVVIGTLDSLDLLCCEFWQPGEIIIIVVILKSCI